jgi:hypothetical protein
VTSPAHRDGQTFGSRKGDDRLDLLDIGRSDDGDRRALRQVSKVLRETRQRLGVGGNRDASFTT